MILNFIVNKVLDIANVVDITQVRILDNSHDKGFIIGEIIEIIINQQPPNLIKILENNIYLIKRNEVEYNQCIERLKTIEIKYNLPEIEWNISFDPTEVYHKFDGYFDIILGKAPYIKVHNTIDDLDRYVFTKNKGITNSFISDYPNEMRILSDYGKLIYIVFNNRASFFINDYMKTKSYNARIHNFIHESQIEGSKIYISLITLTH